MFTANKFRIYVRSFSSHWVVRWRTASAVSWWVTWTVTNESNLAKKDYDDDGRQLNVGINSDKRMCCPWSQQVFVIERISSRYLIYSFVVSYTDYRPTVYYDHNKGLLKIRNYSRIQWRLRFLRCRVYNKANYLELLIIFINCMGVKKKKLSM